MEVMSNPDKYSMTDETLLIYTPMTRLVRRIRAERDIPLFGVKKGDLGGFLETFSNLCTFDDSWISGNSVIVGNSTVTGNSFVYNSQIYDSTIINSTIICSIIRNTEVQKCTVKSSDIREHGVIHGVNIEGEEL